MTRPGPKHDLEPRARPVQPRGARTLNAILDATTAILKESGVEGLTMQVLARRSGVAVGTVYRLFPNKEAVVCQLYEDKVAQVRELADHIRQAATPGPDWRDIFTRYILALKQAEADVDFDKSLAEAMFLIPALRRIDARHAILLADNFADLLRRLGSSWSEAARFDLALTIYCLDAATWQYAYLTGSSGTAVTDRLIASSLALAAPAIEGAAEPVGQGLSSADLLARF